MFHADMTFTLALIALVSGASLILATKKHAEIPTLSCQIIGYTVSVLAIVILLFSGSLMVKGSLMRHHMHSAIMQMHKGHRMHKPMYMHGQRSRAPKMMAHPSSGTVPPGN